MSMTWESLQSNDFQRPNKFNFFSKFWHLLQLYHYHTLAVSYTSLAAKYFGFDVRLEWAWASEIECSSSLISTVSSRIRKSPSIVYSDNINHIASNLSISNLVTRAFMVQNQFPVKEVDHQRKWCRILFNAIFQPPIMEVI